MLWKLLAIAIAVLLLHAVLLVQPAFAASKAEKEARRAAQVKHELSNFGLGENARVAVRLRNKALLGGYLKSTGEDSFVLANLRTGDATTAPNADVTQLRAHNLSTGAKIAIGIAIGVAAVLIVRRSGSIAALADGPMISFRLTSTGAGSST